MTFPRYALMPGMALTVGACSASVHSGSAAPAHAFSSDEISIVTRGSGPDVILIHGLAGNIRVWEPSADSLENHYRLHLVEIHGFGGVPRTSTDSMPTAAIAREVARYIREAKLTRPALIGHSMGGTIALMVAARNPGLVGRVMVVDMTPFMGGMFVPGATADALRPMADQLRTQVLTGNLLDQMVSTMARSEEDRHMLVAYADSSDRLTVANAMHELILTDLRPELSRIDVPLTVLYTARPNATTSPEQLDNAMKQMYSNAAHVTLVRIEDSNHYIQLDQPAHFVAAVETFMGR